tara:strand:+ start:384 stop:539 length:156 start_codon:yes stop_codon:yes gene_type:complete
MQAMPIGIVFDMGYPSGSGTIDWGILFRRQIDPKMLPSDPMDGMVAVSIGT